MKRGIFDRREKAPSFVLREARDASDWVVMVLWNELRGLLRPVVHLADHIEKAVRAVRMFCTHANVNGRDLGRRDRRGTRRPVSGQQITRERRLIVLPGLLLWLCVFLYIGVDELLDRRDFLLGVRFLLRIFTLGNLAKTCFGLLPRLLERQHIDTADLSQPLPSTNTIGVDVGAPSARKNANTEALETRFPVDALMLAPSSDVWEGADSVLTKAGVRHEQGSLVSAE